MVLAVIEVDPWACCEDSVRDPGDEAWPVPPMCSAHGVLLRIVIHGREVSAYYPVPDGPLSDGERDLVRWLVKMELEAWLKQQA